MLFLTKTEKFGMVTIMSVICGVFWFFMGYTWTAIVALKLLDLLPDISSKIVLLAPATNRGMFRNYISIFGKHISSYNLSDIYFSNRLNKSVIQNYEE